MCDKSFTEYTPPLIFEVEEDKTERSRRIAYERRMAQAMADIPPEIRSADLRDLEYADRPRIGQARIEAMMALVAMQYE